MKSKKTTTKSDLADWCAALASKQSTDVVPTGWLTVWDLTAKLGKSRVTTSHLVAAAYKRGELEKKMFRIETPRGVIPVAHYKPVKK